MDRQNEAKMAQPKLAELMTRFLNQRAEDRKAGWPEMPVDEVELHEAAFAPQVEPRTAWEEAMGALRLLGPDTTTFGNALPPGWAAFIQHPVSMPAVVFAAGKYPPLVRDLPELIRAKPRIGRLISRAEYDVAGMESWATQATGKNNPVSAMLGAGILRLGGHFGAARKILDILRGQLPKAWQPALANEEIALDWHSGHYEEAYAKWRQLPDSAPVCFNRGMGALFLDRADDAKIHLKQAIGLLPEDNAWHHLARLYLALAEM